MTRHRFVSAFLVLTLILFGSAPVNLTANTAVAGGALSGIGQITYVEGRVDRHSGADYFPVVRQENISVGDTIRTKSFSRAEIVLSDKSILRIAENSQVQVRDFQPSSDKGAQGSLFVDRGKVRVILPNSKAGSLFQYETPNSKGELKGSDLGVSYQKSATSIIALDGEASAKNINFPDKEIRVSGGNTAYVPYDAPPVNPRPYLKIEKRKFESETNPAPVTPDLSKVRKAIIAKFIGEVRVRTQGAVVWHVPAVKEALGAGDEIETGEGKVLLVLESGREIYLREKTHLKIASLKRDPKTGELEDVLESKLGAIRANIAKKKKGSKFTIKSPVAVAAVKGTILYFFITKTASTSFFEQGNGSLTNLIKKASIDINAGQYGSVGADGETYGPAETSPEKLDEIERGWDIPENTYGYSAPPGVVEVPYEEPEDPLEETDQDTNKPFEEIKPDISGPEGSVLGGEESLKEFGTWGAGGGRSLYSLDNEGFRWEGEDQGRIMAAVFPWTSPQAFVLALTIFSAESEGFKPLLFNTTIGSLIIDPDLNPEFKQSTSDGGAFWGFTAGLWSAVEGTLVALYVDPNKNVGVFTGNVNGLPDFPTNSFEASGFLQPTALGTFPDINPDFFTEYIRYGDAEGGVAGNFGGDDYLEGYLGRAETLFLYDESRENFPSFDFGIYNFQFSGSYYQSESSIWNAQAGGWAEFGFYVPIESEGPQGDEGYWLAEMAGMWADGEIRGNLIGAFLTETHLGVLGGEVTGLYDSLEGSYGNFILQSIGVYESTPLSFFASSSGQFVDADGDATAQFEAYLGGVQSILTDGGTADVFVLGEFDFEYEGSLDRQIWRDDVKSYNAIQDNKTTYDGGAFYAFLAGSSNYPSLKGGFAGIYVGPAGEGEEGAQAGLIRGGLEGEALRGIDMFSLSSTLSTEMKQNVYINAEDMNEENIAITGGGGRLTGAFEGAEGPAGFVSAFDYFQTASLVDYQNGFTANWGIYQQSFNETGFSRPAGVTEWSGFMGGNDPFGFYATYNEEFENYELNQDYGYWIADITNGKFEDGALEAHLNGRFLTGTKMGTLDGDIYGVYEEGEAGYWNAYGVGVWEGQSLDFSGQIINSRGDDFASFLDGEFGEGFFEPEIFGSLQNSLIGGVGNLGGESHILFLGNFDLEERQAPVLWGVEIRSSNIFSENPLTLSGDAFWGFAGGGWTNGEVHGAGRMIYILNDGGYENGYTAGIISGNLNGSFYNFEEDSGMWFAEGDFTAEAKGRVEFSPSDLNGGEYNIIRELDFEAAGVSNETTSEENNLGVILFGAGEFAGIEGEDWGIFAALFGGFYAFDSEFERGSDFRVAFGGSADSYEGEEDYPIYFFGAMAGSLDGENTGTVEADASGVWISETGQQEQFVRVGVIEGKASGNFSNENGGLFGEDGGLIQTAAVGSFTGVTNLDASVINFNQIQQLLLEDSPLTEIANTMAIGEGSFNGGPASITGTMDASFFTSAFNSSLGIWSALFNGSFSGLPGEVNSWAANFEGSDVNAQLTGLNWQDGQWLANVSGTFGPDQTNFTGQAGGTYTTSEADPASGTFSGVGVGTFAAGEQTCQQCV